MSELKDLRVYIDSRLDKLDKEIKNLKDKQNQNEIILESIGIHLDSQMDGIINSIDISIKEYKSIRKVQENINNTIPKLNSSIGDMSSIIEGIVKKFR